MKRFQLIVITAIIGAPVEAVAAAAVELHGEVMLERRIVEDGRERIVLEEPKVVVPGDRLLFSTRFVNSGAKPLDNFVVTNPLPGAVLLSAEAAATLDLSVDGGRTWGRLGVLSVPDEAGGKRPAIAADVTHVRWTLPRIAPGASGTLTYRATVR